MSMPPVAAESSSYSVCAGGPLRGAIVVPGDKSISHRAIILGAIAEGTTEITHFLEGEDALATVAAFRDMGVVIEGPEAGRVRVHGVGMRGLQAPSGPLDLGNSGTAIRLLTGLMAGQRFASVLTGDVSLNTRPMRRVCDPLRDLGADIEMSPAATPPLHVGGAADALCGGSYAMPVASAQVKSSLLLAGMYSQGRVCVREPAPTRDHTERMLRGFGYAVEVQNGWICLQGGGRLVATDIAVPGDFSSAAFFLVAASIVPGSDLLIKAVGINPTRTGALNILRLMGARITCENEREIGGEPVADLRVRHAPLQGIEVPVELVPLAIDEFPVLAIAAACAEGETVISGAEELRVKESDRIDAVATGLECLRIDVTTSPDGMRILGGPLSGGVVQSYGDHRIAMAFAIAGLCAGASVHVQNCENVATSFPGFVATAVQAGVRIQEYA